MICLDPLIFVIGESTKFFFKVTAPYFVQLNRFKDGILYSTHGGAWVYPALDMEE